MNNNHNETDPLLTYQTQRLRELLGELIHCCQDRMIFESKRFDLPQAEIKCLMLFGQERYLTVKGIAGKLEVAKSRVTKLLDGLEARGLIQRLEDPKDARVKLINLTAEGKRRAEAVAGFVLQAHQQILYNLEPERRKAILASLEALRTSMEAVKKGLQ